VSYDIIKNSSKASSFELLIKNITLIEKVEDFYREQDHRFNCHGKPDSYIYYMKDIIKIRLMELKRIQAQKIDELIKIDLNEKDL